MEKANCGNCNWHDEIQLKKTFCLLDKQWYDVSHSCENFVKYSYINREARIKLASDHRKILDDEKREQREREHNEKLAKAQREHEAELAQIQREHADEMADKDREIADKVREENRKFQIKFSLLILLAGYLLRILTELIF